MVMRSLPFLFFGKSPMTTQVALEIYQGHLPISAYQSANSGVER